MWAGICLANVNCGDIVLMPCMCKNILRVVNLNREINISKIKVFFPRPYTYGDFNVLISDGKICKWCAGVN